MDTLNCWICLNQKPLTGEHKFKASDLRSEFGREKMSKFVRGTGIKTHEEIQGVKSKKAKFKNSICAECNGSLTQAADKAYSTFVDMLPDSPKSIEDLYAIYDTKQFFNGTSKECIEVYRYFGKLLGCHVVENDLLIPESLRSFVASENDEVCVYLELKFDEFSQEILQLLAEKGDAQGFVGHGGLTIPCDRGNHKPQRFLSSYTKGIIKFEFWHDLKFNYLNQHYYPESRLFELTQNALKRDGFINK